MPAHGASSLTVLLRVAAQVLGEPATIDPHARFETLGLDSLAMMRFARQAGDALGITFEFEWLLDHGTLAALARFLDERESFDL